VFELVDGYKDGMPNLQSETTLAVIFYNLLKEIEN
jgi:hypothetical protein